MSGCQDPHAIPVHAVGAPQPWVNCLAPDLVGLRNKSVDLCTSEIYLLRTIKVNNLSSASISPERTHLSVGQHSHHNCLGASEAQLAPWGLPCWVLTFTC